MSIEEVNNLFYEFCVVFVKCYDELINIVRM